MADMMTFPDSWEEFEKTYGFTDSDMVYTNGSRLIQSFRVKQWLDHEAVKVVRCKDCRWAYPRKLKGETGVHCVFHRIDKDNNGYCDTGEARETAWTK